MKIKQGHYIRINGSTKSERVYLLLADNKDKMRTCIKGELNKEDLTWLIEKLTITRNIIWNDDKALE